MSNRERWVIYPLLFFAFLMGARDEYAKPERFDCEAISCRLLTVRAADGQPLVTIGPSEDESGSLVIYSSWQGLKLPGEQVETGLRPPGHEILEVGANDYGGYLRVFGSRPGSDLQLGHDGQLRFSGLTSIDADDDYIAAPDSSEAVPVWGSVLPWPEEEQQSAAEAEIEMEDETPSDTSAEDAAADAVD